MQDFNFGEKCPHRHGWLGRTPPPQPICWSHFWVDACGDQVSWNDHGVAARYCIFWASVHPFAVKQTVLVSSLLAHPGAMTSPAAIIQASDARPRDGLPGQGDFGTCLETALRNPLVCIYEGVDFAMSRVDALVAAVCDANARLVSD
jgi:hypothetical protein